jgi:Radial spoke protein 3
VRRERVVREKVAAATFARGFLTGAVDGALTSLWQRGHFYDPVERAVKDDFMPWLRNSAGAELARRNAARATVVAMVQDAVGRLEAEREAKRAERKARAARLAEVQVRCTWWSARARCTKLHCAWLDVNAGRVRSTVWAHRSCIRTKRRVQCRESFASHGQAASLGENVSQPGVEPGSQAWKAYILTVGLPTHRGCQRSCVRWIHTCYVLIVLLFAVAECDGFDASWPVDLRSQRRKLAPS